MTASRIPALVRLAVVLAATALAVEALVLAADPRVDLPGRHRLGTPILVALALGALATLAAALAATVADLRRRRPFPGALALRLAFETFVGTAAFVVLRLQPFQDPHSRYVLALAAGAWGGALLVLHAGGGRPLPRALAVLELVAFNLCLFAALAEVALRGLERSTTTPWTGREDRLPRRFVEARRRDSPPGTLLFGFPLDARSYNDEPPRPGDPRPVVAQIGDSFSYGVVPHLFHYTTVAERALGDAVVVANLGYPGAGPHEYLEILRSDGLGLRPAAVAISVFVGNDLWELDRVEAESPWLGEAMSRDRSRLFQVGRRLGRLLAEAWARGGAPARVQGETTAGLVTGREAILAAYPWLLDGRLEAPTFSADRYLAVELDRAGHAAAPGADYRLLVAVLAEMRALVPERPFLVVLVPDDFQLDDGLWASIAASRPELERELPQRRLGALLSEAGIPTLDLLPALRASCAARHGERSCYQLRDTHWNARGNCVAGVALGRALGLLLGVEASADPGCAVPLEAGPPPTPVGEGGPRDGGSPKDAAGDKLAP